MKLECMQMSLFLQNVACIFKAKIWCDIKWW